MFLSWGSAARCFMRRRVLDVGVWRLPVCVALRRRSVEGSCLIVAIRVDGEAFWVIVISRSHHNVKESQKMRGLGDNAC